MAAQQELIDDIFNFLQNSGPRPTWMSPRISAMVDYAHDALARGVNDPSAYIGSFEQTLRSVVPTEVYGAQVSPRNATRVMPTAAPVEQAGSGGIFSSAPNAGNALTAYTPSTPTGINPATGGVSTPASMSFADYLKANPDGGDAYAYVSGILREYGLESLDKWAQDSIMNDLSSDQIVQSMREQDPYKQRFKAIVQRKEAGLPPISESEVVNYEKQATTLMRAAGLPAGFWDEPDDFVKLQTSDVSLSELDARVNQGYLAVMQAPQDVRDQWNQLGYNTGDMVAYFLDPSRTETVLQKQLTATERAAEAARTGYGQLSTTQAEDLASRGVTQSQSEQGFAKLVQNRELFDSLPGENANGISQDQQLGAVFKNDVASQQAIERRAAERVAQFGGGGGFTASQDGRTGIGAAR
jgi:hypothetical protein